MRIHKIILFLVAIATFFSCKENRLDLPSGTPKEVLSNDLFNQLSQKYDDIKNFEYGYAIVKKEKYGIINYKGEEVLNCINDTIIRLNLDTKIIEQNHKYGIVEYDGEKISEIEYDSLAYKANSDANIIAFMKAKKWGILDSKGNTIIPFEYDATPAIDINCAVIGKNGKYGMCDSIGNIIVNMKYDTIYYHFDESNISLTEQNNHIGIINSQNKVVTACIYNCEYFTDETGRTPKIKESKNGYIKMVKYLADADKPKQYGLIECETGKEAVPFEYDDLGDYSEGLIWAEKDNKFGYIDINNRVVIQFKYENAYNFSEGLAAVAIGNGYRHVAGGLWRNYRIGFIDKNGNEIIPFIFQPQLVAIPEFHNGLAPMGVSSDNFWGFDIGYINKKGTFTIAPIYSDAKPFRNGLGEVELDGRYGCINTSGKPVIPITYRFVYFENDTLVHCQGDNETHYYSNHNGKIKEQLKPTDNV